MNQIPFVYEFLTPTSVQNFQVYQRRQKGLGTAIPVVIDPKGKNYRLTARYGGH